MGGLLEFLSSPEAQLGLGLLGASGPTTDPNQSGFGQRLQAGMGYARQQQEAEMKRKLAQAQMDNYQSEIEQRKVAAEQQQRKQAMLEKILGGSSQAMGATNLVNDALPSGMQIGAQSAMPARGGIENASLDQLAQLKALGGVDLTDIRKLAQPTPLANGWVRDFNGKERYMADPTKGFSFENGRVSNTPGFLEANAAMVGGAAQAQESAKAKYDPFTYTPQGGTNPVLTSRGSVMGGEPGMKAAVSGDMGADTAGIQREIAATTADLKRTLDPSSRAQLQAHLADLNRQGANVQASGGVALQSPSEAAKLLDQAKADIVPTQQRQSAIASGNYLSQVLDMAIKHPGRETATGLSGTLDPRNYTPGTDAKNFGVVLDQIKGSAFMQAYQSLKGGGQITEVEGKKATEAIARMNTAQSDGEFLKSLNEFKVIVDGANTRMQGGGSAAEAQKPADLMQSLPTANASNRGKRIRDTETGKTLVSNGMSWVAE